MIIKNRRLTDHELLNEVLFQSRTGAELLYDRYAKALLLAILRHVPDRDSAHNILCKTYQIAWQTICTYQQNELSLLAWMRRIALKEAVIHCKANTLLNNIH